MSIHWQPIGEAPGKTSLLVCRKNGLPFDGDNIAVAYKDWIDDDQWVWFYDHEPFDREVQFKPTHFAYLPDVTP